MTPTLVLIPVPPEEAKHRMAVARQAAKHAKKKADAGRQFIATNKRMAETVAKLDAEVALNARIAKGCKEALDELVIQAPSEEPVMVEGD